MAYDVSFTNAPERLLAVHRWHVPADQLALMGGEMGRAFETVLTHLGRAGVTAGGPAVACYQQTGDGFDVAAGFPVDETFAPSEDVDQLVIGAEEVARTTHFGPYDGLPAAYEAVRAAAEARGLAVDDRGPMWEEYWSGPDVPADQHRTEVFWPVRSR